MTGWQPIDTAPRDGADLLLFSPDATAPGVMLGFFTQFEDQAGIVQHEGWTDTWTGEEIDADPTHWRPLPEAPSPQSFAGGVGK